MGIIISLTLDRYVLVFVVMLDLPQHLQLSGSAHYGKNHLNIKGVTEICIKVTYLKNKHRVSIKD